MESGADDQSAFAPLPITSATQTSPATHPSVTVDLEFPSRQDAEEVVSKYNGAVADGNTLKVVIVPPPQRGLAERMGGGIKGASGNGNGNALAGVSRNGAGSGAGFGGSEGRREELMPSSSSRCVLYTSMSTTPCCYEYRGNS